MTDKHISLLNEKALLKARITNVEREIDICFVDKQTDDENFNLLQLQLSSMKNYYRTLEKRIELAKASEKKC